MDELNKRIKDYVMIIYPEVTDDKFLNYVVDEVVDRALLYMNRQQLVAGYERFLLGKPNYYYGDYTIDVTGTDQPILPIPSELERPLARVIVGSYKTVADNVANDTNAIKSISDNGQSITYGEEVVSYLSSKDDSDVFSSIRKLLDKFRIPTIVENT
jgi:hypothetical protein